MVAACRAVVKSVLLADSCAQNNSKTQSNAYVYIYNSSRRLNYQADSMTQACDPGKLQLQRQLNIKPLSLIMLQRLPCLSILWLSRLLTRWQGCLLHLWHWELDTDRGAWELTACCGPVVIVLWYFIDMVVSCCEKCSLDENPGTSVLISPELFLSLSLFWYLISNSYIYIYTYHVIIISPLVLDVLWAPPGWPHRSSKHYCTSLPSDRRMHNSWDEGFLRFPPVSALHVTYIALFPTHVLQSEYVKFNSLCSSCSHAGAKRSQNTCNDCLCHWTRRINLVRHTALQ